MLSFDYDRVRNRPPLPHQGAHPIEEMWNNVTCFLKAVVPVAVASRVRLALHPNDPPAPISRGSGQIMGSVEGWKRLVDIVPSPYNGITFDCGVTREQYTEVFPDEGEVNMFAVMKELVRQRYPRLIYPEHPRGLDADRGAAQERAVRRLDLRRGLRPGHAAGGAGIEIERDEPGAVRPPRKQRQTRHHSR